MDQLDEPVLWPSAGVAAVWLVARRDSPARWAEIIALGALTMFGLVITGMGPILAAVHSAAAVTVATIFSVAAGRWMPALWTDRSDQPSPARLGELWRIVLVAFVATTAGSFIEALGERLINGEVSTYSTM